MNNVIKIIPASQLKTNDRIDERAVRSAWLDENGVRVLYWDATEPVYLDPEQEVTIQRQQA